jgi:hypothetical protein
MTYPNSTPEFRILKAIYGNAKLQVRYINITQGYQSKWQDVPLLEQEREKINVCN